MGVLIGHHGTAPLGATEYFRLWHEDLDHRARLGSRRVAVVQLRPLGDVQLVPEAWMRDSTQVAPHIKAHCPENDWLYGHGFWSNSEGMIWPELPRDGFHSWGAGGHYTAVFPGEELVIVQNPDPLGVRGGEGANLELIELVFAACD